MLSRKRSDRLMSGDSPPVVKPQFDCLPGESRCRPAGARCLFAQITVDFVRKRQMKVAHTLLWHVLMAALDGRPDSHVLLSNLDIIGMSAQRAAPIGRPTTGVRD